MAGYDVDEVNAMDRQTAAAFQCADARGVLSWKVVPSDVCSVPCWSGDSMSEDVRHECGVAALYLLKEAAQERLPEAPGVAALLSGMLLDLQNRGQLAAGVTTYDAGRPQILKTHRGVGTVSEVLQMSRPDEHAAIISDLAGQAAIGHVRYATCGLDDVRHAQPFERQHGRLWKWFCFAFNGNLANFAELRERLLAKELYHFVLNTDTEMIMHSIAYGLRGDSPTDLRELMGGLARDFDGAYNIAFLDGLGRMFVARDPLGLRPMSWTVENGVFAAASESVALINAGFRHAKPLEPGEMVIVEDGELRVERFAPTGRKARCFFEWVYFSNVASSIDGAGVYLTRANTGRLLAEQETVEVNGNCVAVAVPDTAKAAADAFAYALSIPSMEGLIRNRYVGRTFIQPPSTRGSSAGRKYTPLPSVLAGRRVFLVEDSIVRATTLRALAARLREEGRAREVHVRVACPPIVAPCFYGIDMSTLGELFAPRHVPADYDGHPDAQTLTAMAEALGVDSLRYLEVDDLGPCIGVEPASLCLGCVTGRYPTACGNALMEQARRNFAEGRTGRTYERPVCPGPGT
jgi:amidophosphoribosyltransferase